MTRRDHADRRPHAVGAVTLVAGFVLVGCAGTTAEEDPAADPAGAGAATPEAVPWESVDRFAEATRGTYVKRLGAIIQGGAVEPMFETVIFDLDEALVDRTIDVSGSDELRYLYTEDVVLMHNPSVEPTCGTPWVDMGSGDDLTGGMGTPVEPSEFLTVEPLDILEQAGNDDAVAVTTTDASTVYELIVPGGTGLGMSTALIDDPALLEAIHSLEHKALITVPRGDGPLLIDVDVTNLLHATDKYAAPDTTMTISWELTVDTPVDIPLPTNVADIGCME